jgi:cytochrome c oxidase cbb3-type subunit 2
LKLTRPLAIVAALAVLGGGTACKRKAPGPPLADPALEHGRQVYFANCVPCHGETGHGDGPVARSQPRPPRDFSSCNFQFGSGGPGTLPSDDDLFHTVTFGVPTSTMPSFASLDETDRRDVIRYVKTFCPRFESEGPSP